MKCTCARVTGAKRPRAVHRDGDGPEAPDVTRRRIFDESGLPPELAPPGKCLGRVGKFNYTVRSEKGAQLEVHLQKKGFFP